MINFLDRLFGVRDFRDGFLHGCMFVAISTSTITLLFALTLWMTGKLG